MSADVIALRPNSAGCRFQKPNGEVDGRVQRRLNALRESDARGARWRGNLSVPTTAHPLVQELFNAMNRDKVAMRDLAARAGMDFQTISAWRYVSNPTLPMFEAALNALGYRLKIVPEDKE